MIFSMQWKADLSLRSLVYSSCFIFFVCQKPVLQQQTRLKASQHFYFTRNARTGMSE
uniref:Uncharacterized protein n=1 Tax=Anguilla anguilla TaxID=7936 RepID=A0A0E9XG88_ANGAN